MMMENNIWNTLCKAKSRSQSVSLNDLETFEDGVISISKDNRSIISERTKGGLDQCNQMMIAGAVPFVRQCFYYVSFFKCSACEIISVSSDANFSNKVELQEFQALNPSIIPDFIKRLFSLSPKLRERLMA